MTSDTINPPRDVPFRAAGTGIAQTRQCGCCGRPQGTFLGRGLRMVRGMRTWVCGKCKRGEK